MDSGHPCIVDPRSTLGSRGSAPVLPTPETPFQLFEKGLIRGGGHNGGGTMGDLRFFRALEGEVKNGGGGGQEWWMGWAKVDLRVPWVPGGGS